MKFKQAQRFLAIVDGISFYTTAKQIRDGVGNRVSINRALREAMRSLQDMRSGTDVTSCASGLGGNYEGYQIQLDMVFDMV